MKTLWMSSFLRYVTPYSADIFLKSVMLLFSVPVWFFQIEEIRTSIDKIDENVTEIKRLYSVILSAPTSDQSKLPSSSLPVSHL